MTPGHDTSASAMPSGNGGKSPEEIDREARIQFDKALTAFKENNFDKMFFHARRAAFMKKSHEALKLLACAALLVGNYGMAFATWRRLKGISIDELKLKGEEHMSFENLQEIIQFAIDREKEAAEFYQSIAKEETFSGVKDMLEEFAGQERKHQAMLEEFQEKGVVSEVEKYQLKWIPDMKRSNYLADMEYEKGMGYADIMRIAMKREEKALKLYNELLEKVNTPEAKKLFQVLCQEEAKHKLGLETAYDEYMASMGD